MSLKLIWKRVTKTGLTQLPVWDEKPRVPVAPEQPEKSWERVVLIDPTRSTIPVDERKDALVNGKLLKDAVVVPLSSFYRFQLGAQQAASLGAAEGDWMVLVAMHYTTKEIPNWVWATFWWHDKPEVGQYAADKPGSAVLKNVWRNYLMDVSYDMDSPKESDGTPNAVFNPYLEAGFANGVNSNCMTCHQRAVWTKKGASFRPITRGAAKPTDAHFKDATMVDFLWSLLLEGGN